MKGKGPGARGQGPEDRGQWSAELACADVEALVADYLDGTLPGDAKSAVEAHLASCAACAELARDAGAAVAFMGRAADIEAPPELVTRILFEVSNGPSRKVIRPSWGRRVFGKWLEPVLQPRFAMGMAMTMLSFAMLFKFANIPERSIKPSDLDPVKVWAAAEDRVVRWWERGVKYYENLRVVYEIQTRLKEWTQEEPADETQPPQTPAPQNSPAGGKE
jgi:hypothetical protein